MDIYRIGLEFYSCSISIYIYIVGVLSVPAFSHIGLQKHVELYITHKKTTKRQTKLQIINTQKHSSRQEYKTNPTPTHQTFQRTTKKNRKQKNN